MAASRATTGNTAVFYLGTVASPLGYFALLEVKSIKPDLGTTPEVPTTHLNSPNATEEFIPGLIKPGKIVIMGNLIGDATQLSLLPLQQGQTLAAFKFTAPVDNKTKTYTCTGTCFVSNYTPDGFEQNKANEFKLEVQITGSPVESVS